MGFGDRLKEFIAPEEDEEEQLELTKFLHTRRISQVLLQSPQIPTSYYSNQETLMKPRRSVITSSQREPAV